MKWSGKGRRKGRERLSKRQERVGERSGKGCGKTRKGLWKGLVTFVERLGKCCGNMKQYINNDVDLAQCTVTDVCPYWQHS